MVIDSERESLSETFFRTFNGRTDDFMGTMVAVVVVGLLAADVLSFFERKRSRG